MNKPSNQELIDRIITRLQTDTKNSSTASSSQLKQTTTQLIGDARQLNAAFSAPGLASRELKQKTPRTATKG